MLGSYWLLRVQVLNIVDPCLLLPYDHLSGRLVKSSQKSTIFSLAQTSTPITMTTFLLIGVSLGFVGKHPLH